MNGIRAKQECNLSWDNNGSTALYALILNILIDYDKKGNPNVKKTTNKENTSLYKKNICQSQMPLTIRTHKKSMSCKDDRCS